MGNQASGSIQPPSSRYQSSSLPDSFFAENPSMTEKPPPYARHSSVAYADTADVSKIVFRTSDGEYFSVNKKDVDAHASALIPDNWSSRSMVDLPETSTILRTLFEFIGPRKHPKLLNEKFEVLAEVAKAAEKYKVFSAMNICAERMRSYGDRHPKLVLLYAAYNDYPHIFDECAPRVVTSENLEQITPLLPDHLRLPWLRYHARWSQVLTEITSYSTSSNPWSSSACWRTCGLLIYQALATGVHSLNNVDWVFEDRIGPHTNGCSQCRNLSSTWKTHTEKLIGEVGIFSETCVNIEPLVKVT